MKELNWKRKVRVPLQNAFEIFTAANFIDYGDVVSYLMFLHFRFK